MAVRQSRIAFALFWMTAVGVGSGCVNPRIDSLRSDAKDTYKALLDEHSPLDAAVAFQTYYDLSQYCMLTEPGDMRAYGRLIDESGPILAQLSQPEHIDDLIMVVRLSKWFSSLNGQPQVILARMLGVSPVPDDPLVLVRYYKKFGGRIKYSKEKGCYVPDAFTFNGRLPEGFVPVPDAGVGYGGLPLRIRCLADDSEMLLVPPGRCYIGKPVLPVPESAPAGVGPGDIETPQEYVLPWAFYMDRYPITNRQYKQYCERTGADGPHYAEKIAKGYRADQFGRSDTPVTCVTPSEAMSYAKWARKVIPTEVEWMRAARSDDLGPPRWYLKAGAKLTDQAEILKYAVLCSDVENAAEPDGPQAVTGHTAGASPFGIEDMIGNVEELTSSVTLPGKYDICGLTYIAKWSELSTSYLQYGSIADNVDKADHRVGFRCILPIIVPRDETVASQPAQISSLQESK